MKISRNTFKPLIATLIGAASLFSIAASHANDKYREERATSVDEIYQIIERGLPVTLGDDNSALAKQLLSVKPTGPLTNNLQLDTLVTTFFANKPVTQGNCELRSQNVNCTAALGEKAGKGAYSQLRVNTRNSETNVRFAKRSAADSPLAEVTLGDREAYERALALVSKSFALGTSDIPVAPKNARNPYPVRTINVALAQSEKPQKIVAVEKLVTLPRGVYAGELGWLPGPGEWSVSLDNLGINTASVRNWADMSRYGEGLRAENIKSRKDLVEELVERFQHEGIEKLASANSHIAIVRLEGAEVPVPVLRVYAAPQVRSLTEEQQAEVVSSAGVVLDLPLFAQYDERVKSDD